MKTLHKLEAQAQMAILFSLKRRSISTEQFAAGMEITQELAEAMLNIKSYTWPISLSTDIADHFDIPLEIMMNPEHSQTLIDIEQSMK